jgi:tripartite-type tricarboxylate transporter receptor subunit TctC
MQKSVSVFISGLAAMGVAALSTGASAQSAAEVYKDRTVTILVGYSAGGTYGRTSLLLSEYLGNYVPGKPNMVVQHMPGAGGIKAANYFYNVAPKNGQVLLMPPEMTVASELLRPGKVKYKTNKFTWLGRVFGQNTTLVLLRSAGVTSLDQLKKQEVIVGSSGKGSPTFLIPTLMNALLDTKLKIITGYRGSKPLQLATEQGEVQGIALGWTAWTTGRPTWFKGGDKSRVVALAQSGYSRQKGAEHVPLISELLNNDEDKAVAKMLGSAGVLGRGLVLPPGAPSNLVDPLRAAFSAVTKDEAFKRNALKRGLLVDPIEGAEIQRVINKLMSTPASVVKRARKLIFPKKSS